MAILFVMGCSSSAESGDETPPRPKVMATPEGMVRIPGGTFVIGSTDGPSDERPTREVTISEFFLDRYEVTNDDFARFVAQTGYVTTAERTPDSKDFPTVPLDKLVPGAAVFSEKRGWSYVPGANWRHPEGPGSTIEGKGDHPVVQVSWHDAAAYAKWADKRLPTEAEWEYAARAGVRTRFIWGDTAFDETRPQANLWQGPFPTRNDDADGFRSTAPVGSFPSTGHGLYDMAGNVWEWCQDWYRPDAYRELAALNPTGPSSSFDPAEPEVPKRVLRGGSFLCAENYCRGYRPSARMKSSPDTGLFHTGFRCAKSIPIPPSPARAGR